MSELKMGFRWFGPDDAVTLNQIKQIPLTKQIVGALNLEPGQVWPAEAINQLKTTVEAAGLKLEVIESVNVHDDIKAGLPSRDHYIQNYITTIKNLSAAGVKVICYNFMPAFDWIRTTLNAQNEDGSRALEFRQADLPDSPAGLFQQVSTQATHFELPGWEPERLDDLNQIIANYQGVTATDLLNHLKYFLDAIIPVCEEFGVTMALHPDDPPMAIFGLPRIYKNLADMRQIEALHQSPRNAFTICTGSLGEDATNDVPAIIREFTSKGKAPFIHLRNIRHLDQQGDFRESAHESSEGSLDMYAIMKALHDSNFNGYARPDHGRNIWNENGRPGYGLYDRALGATYLNGLWEAVQKSDRA